jgi:glycosyltransferase involved in cell wall biosynthesis
MNVLVIGSDRSIANPHSASAHRQIAYGTRLGELDIIVFSLRNQRLSMQTLAIGVRVHPTGSRSRLWYGWDAFRIARGLAKPDVVSVQDPFEAGLVGLFLARWFRIPLHVQVHADFLSPEFAKLSLMNRIRVYLAGIVLPHAARIRVVSPRIEESIAQRYALKVPMIILPIFIDLERFKNASAGELTHRFAQFKQRLLVVSRLEKEKNVELAIKSFEKAAPESACLIIVGDGRERKHLEKNASARVFFEGQRDPAPYYALADLVLVSSVYEGYGLVTIEALGAGKPVLSTDVGIAREAGAIIASPEEFPTMLASWLEEGMREGKLLNYPYHSFDEYVQKYCDDIAASKR